MKFYDRHNFQSVFYVLCSTQCTWKILPGAVFILYYKFLHTLELYLYLYNYLKLLNFCFYYLWSTIQLNVDHNILEYHYSAEMTSDKKSYVEKIDFNCSRTKYTHFSTCTVKEVLMKNSTLFWHDFSHGWMLENLK
jgi:hypothetical protein